LFHFYCFVFWLLTSVSSFLRFAMQDIQQVNCSRAALDGFFREHLRTSVFELAQFELSAHFLQRTKVQLFMLGEKFFSHEGKKLHAYSCAWQVEVWACTVKLALEVNGCGKLEGKGFPCRIHPIFGIVAHTSERPRIVCGWNTSNGIAVDGQRGGG
jgi:hypothetical protein